MSNPLSCRSFWPRAFIFAALILHAAWYLWPTIEVRWLTEDQLTILQYGAFGAAFDMPEWSYWAFLVATFVALGSALLLGRQARHFVLAHFLLSVIVLVPPGGIAIETGSSMAIRDLSNLATGGVIVLLYCCSE